MCYFSSDFPTPQTLNAEVHIQFLPLNLKQDFSTSAVLAFGAEESYILEQWGGQPPLDANSKSRPPKSWQSKVSVGQAKLHQLRTTGLKQSYFPSEKLINVYTMSQTTNSGSLFCKLT